MTKQYLLNNAADYLSEYGGGEAQDVRLHEVGIHTKRRIAHLSRCTSASSPAKQHVIIPPALLVNDKNQIDDDLMQILIIVLL